ncbi:MAG: LPS-assembly protein LptD [Thermoanaerobaculaceae bacterium]|nr:LPS-assembly protein LptD [Thermoanaerobaculaceae bacterium]
MTRSPHSLGSAYPLRRQRGARPALHTATALLALVAVAVGAGWIGAAEEAEQLVKLEALNQQWIQDQVWCGTTDVKIAYQDVSLRCDEIEVDLATMGVKAAGNVIMDQGNVRIACERLEFDLRAKVGRFYGVDASFPPSYRFRGRELEKLDETHYHVVDGLFTSCSLSEGEAPPWSIEIREASFEIEGYGHFKGAALKVRGVPIFYTPRLLWPVKRDRAAGMLVPNVGYNDRRGAYLGNAFFWPISRSLDTTTYLDLYSKGYVGVGQEARWTPAENAQGEMLAYAIRDPSSNDWQWKLLGKYSQLFAGGYSLKSEINDVSDLDFFQRFERTFDQNAMRTLFSYLTLTRSWGPQTLNVRADHRETYFSSATSATAVVMERRPELEYRLRSTRLGHSPFYLTLVGVADQFRVERSATLIGTYGRFDLFPTVSLLTPGLPWLNLTPSVGARATYYTAQYSSNRTTLVDEPITRTYGTAGLSVVGPSFSRIWTGQGVKVKHLLEPRLEYAYVSDPGAVASIPLFDEKDSVLVTNRLRASLANRLFVKRGQGAGREVATFEITQEYSFSDLLTFPRSGFEGSRRGPLGLWLRTSPTQGTTVDARAELDAVTKKLRSTALSTGMSLPSTQVNLTWYSSYDPVSGATTSSQSRLGLGLGPTSAPWRLDASAAYDIHRGKLLEHRYALRWRGSCWTAYLEFRDYRIEPYRTRDYRLAIDLTGLGTFLDVHGRTGSGGL